MIDNFALYIVILCSFVIHFLLIFLTKNVCYAGPSARTDNERIVRASNEIKLLSWPSRMHSIIYNRSQVREYWTLFIKILTYFTSNKTSDHLNIKLALLSNFVSSILFFLILNNFFSTEIALIFSLFYLTSFWPYQVAIYMGHSHLSQTFFLLSILCLQNAISSNLYILFFSSGLCIAISFFSSSASRKYPPVFFFSFIFFLQDYFFVPNFDFFKLNINYIIIIFIFFIFCYFPIHFLFLKKKDKKIKRKINGNILLYFSLFYFTIFFIDYNLENIKYIIFTGLGALLIFIHIFFPISNFAVNLRRYYNWFYNSKWASHFNAYPDHIKTFGKKLGANFRGGGFNWNNSFFFQSMPILYPLYIICFVYLIFHSLYDYINTNNFHFINLFIIFISLLPLFIHEASGGLKVGKTYFCILIFFIFLISYSFNNFFLIYNFSLFFYLILFFLLIFQIIHSLWILLSDTIPIRMAPTILRNYLIKNKIQEFYTYKNTYNDALVHTMISTFKDEFVVKYIDKLDDVNEGTIVIPNTSSKSVSMETQKYAIINGDFNKDYSLNKLYENKQIEKICLLKIKTMGTSKYYVNESEVTTYRYHVLNDISDYDRWLGNAWIIQKPFNNK